MHSIKMSYLLYLLTFLAALALTSKTTGLALALKMLASNTSVLNIAP